MGQLELRVVAPCSQDWNGMAGDDRARFCSRCDLTVHDLSAISEADARALLAAGAERMCVRFGVRRDGTVVTRGGGRWLGSGLGALGIAVAAVVFWAGVTLLQRPWRALARRLTASTSPVPQPFQPSADDLERRPVYAKVMKRLPGATPAMMAAHSKDMMMGEISRVEGTLDLGVPSRPPKLTKEPRR